MMSAIDMPNRDLTSKLTVNYYSLDILCSIEMPPASWPLFPHGRATRNTSLYVTQLFKVHVVVAIPYAPLDKLGNLCVALLSSPASVETPSPSKSPLQVVHALGWEAVWVGKGSSRR